VKKPFANFIPPANCVGKKGDWRTKLETAVNPDLARMGSGSPGKIMASESLVTNSQRCLLRAKFLILSEACSFDEVDQCCPFHKIIGKSLKQRIAWLDGLSDEAMLNIYTHCRRCVEGR